MRMENPFLVGLLKRAYRLKNILISSESYVHVGTVLALLRQMIVNKSQSAVSCDLPELICFDTISTKSCGVKKKLTILRT